MCIFGKVNLNKAPLYEDSHMIFYVVTYIMPDEYRWALMQVGLVHEICIIDQMYQAHPYLHKPERGTHTV